jgi:hypothetical protein
MPFYAVYVALPIVQPGSLVQLLLSLNICLLG